MSLSVFLGLLLCAFPLVNLLGYESAAVAGAVLGIGAMVRTSLLFGRGALPSPLDPRGPGALALYLDLARGNLALVLPAAALLLLNALRVKNCDIPLGIAFWGVIPPVSVLAGQAIAFATAPLPRGRLALALGVVLVQTLAFLWRLAWQPPIAGHTWTIGWFAGSLYDEAIQLPRGLLWARVGVLLGSAALVLGLELAWRRRGERALGGLPLALAVVLAGLLTLHHQRAALNIQHDQASVKEALGGLIETEHFRIHYDPGSLDERARELIALDHEFRYAEMVSFFDEDPVQWRGRPIDSFVYGNRKQQQRLLGSRQTLVARPWTHQMHIRWSEIGDTALAHELAHLFTAPFGRGPLQLPMRWGLIPDMALIEGVASAADAPPDELSVHQASRAMRELGLAPDLRQLFDPAGFWNQPGARAYTTASSFVQWLIARHGIATFKQAYRDADLEAAYGRSLDELVGEWEGWVDQVELSDGERALAGHRYRRGSIFQRACARTMGELARLAGQAEARGALDRAIALRERMRDLEPGSPEHRLELARLKAKAGDTAGAMEIAARMAEREELGPVRQATARELVGDLRWGAGEVLEANREYERCLSLPLDEGRTRRLLVKHKGTQGDEEGAERARRYLLDEGLNSAARLWRALSWAELDPSDPVPRYLVGRTLHQNGEHGAARPWLERAGQKQAGLEQAGLEAQVLLEPSLEDERRLLEANAALRAGAPGEAEGLYARLMDETASSRVRALAAEGVDRARFEASLAR